MEMNWVAVILYEGGFKPEFPELPYAETLLSTLMASHEKLNFQILHLDIWYVVFVLFLTE